MGKANTGRFFDDFVPGETIAHATPLTLSAGDASLYRALTGARHVLYSSEPFAAANGQGGGVLDPLLVFHTVFGKTVPDISLNAVANLGYAEGRFLAPVRMGDTLRAVSQVIGAKVTSSGKAGVVHVRTTGLNQRDEAVLSYVRWVMVNRADAGIPARDAVVPVIAPQVAAGDLPRVDYPEWDTGLSGSRWFFEDYEVGERIDHVDGMAVEEAEHQIATRLYQNTAKVHFDQHAQAQGRFGRRLIYGGVVISLARSLSFNGLGNACQMLAINAGTHANPLFAGSTVYAWSQVLDRAELSETAGALRLRLVATKDHPCADFPLKDDSGAYHPHVLLDFDYWAAIPRRR